MSRNDLIADLQRNSERVWDVVIIGGGATGLGIALDSVTRGYKTLLLEKGDFATATSSRSTKLVHGGVRYLAQGDLLLVVEALRERGLLLKNAPRVSNNQEFVIPLYRLWDVILYYVGLKFYDILAARLSLGKSHYIRPRMVRSRLPLIKMDGLRGGIVYHDGQFDDARLALGLATTAISKGATVLNYFTASGFIKDNKGKITSVKATDNITGRNYLINTGLVINATGVFSDSIHTLDNPFSKPTIRPSQGVHIVLDRSFLQSESALMIPKTSDGRVLFAIPWCGSVVVGTTDTPVEKVLEEPVALEHEIEFILATAGRYLTRAPRREDILSIFAGLRPLAAREGNPGSTKEVSRRHKIIVAPSGLLTIIGGKWTTYRCMAEETIDRAIRAGMLPESKCMTRNMAIDATPALSLPVDEETLTRIVRDEMVCNVDDVLSRRTRMLMIDARRSVDMAPHVAAVMARELGYDKEWEEKAVEDYRRLAENYV